MQLPKDPRLRATNSWEYPSISTSLIHYAACDVLVTRRIFETMSIVSDVGTPDPGVDSNQSDDLLDDYIGGVQVATADSIEFVVR